ncbi:MAG: metal ABC transporter ATP-binding protein [Acidimicrobiia bacterium]|nr:metal ABC transporter ATP-binding protein [Acidimicrobiia bacterium]
MRLTHDAVVATDVVLSYGGHIAVERSSFTIPRPGITAIIGPNGSGKSTILNAVAGLLTPLSGTINTTGEGGGCRISYVLQTTRVNDNLPLSVDEVVTMGRYPTTGWFSRMDADDRARVESAMDRTGASDFRLRHLHELSGGQRQRAFLAQGLAQDHDILLLDEPMAGIDQPTAQAIDDVIHDEADEGCAVVVTTHDLTEAQVADHVILVNGRVIASGPPEEVITPEHLDAAYGSAVLHPDHGVPMIDDPAHPQVD